MRNIPVSKIKKKIKDKEYVTIFDPDTFLPKIILIINNKRYKIVRKPYLNDDMFILNINNDYIYI